MLILTQILLENPNQLLLVRLRVYISSYWNRLDVICLILFFVGFPLANLNTSLEDLFKSKDFKPEDETIAFFQEIGRVQLIFSLLLYFVRLLQVFCIHKLFGPKIVMVGRMVQSCFLLYSILHYLL